MARVEIDNPALDLAAHGAGLADPSRPFADRRRRPACAPTARRRRVPLAVVLSGFGPLAFSAQLLHAGADGREVVGSARSAHGVSSLLGSAPVKIEHRGGFEVLRMVNNPRQVSGPPGDQTAVPGLKPCDIRGRLIDQGLNGDRRHPGAFHAQFVGSARREVEDAPARVWTPIVDFDDDRAAVVEVRHLRMRGQRK